MGSTQTNTTHVGWVGLSQTYVIGWVEFFFNQPWWVKSKNFFHPTQADPSTPLPIDLEASLAKIYEYFSIIIFKNISIKLFILHFILSKYYFLSIFYYSPKSSNLHIQSIHIISCKKKNLYILSLLFFTYSLFKTPHIRLSVLHYIRLKYQFFFIFLIIFPFSCTMTTIHTLLSFSKFIKKE